MAKKKVYVVSPLSFKVIRDGMECIEYLVVKGDKIVVRCWSEEHANIICKALNSKGV